MTFSILKFSPTLCEMPTKSSSLAGRKLTERKHTEVKILKQLYKTLKICKITDALFKLLRAIL